MVIPKAVRNQLGLRGGESVEIALRDGQIVIEPASVPMRFDADAGCIVAEPGGAMPPLATNEVRARHGARPPVITVDTSVAVAASLPCLAATRPHRR